MIISFRRKTQTNSCRRIYLNLHILWHILIKTPSVCENQCKSWRGIEQAHRSENGSKLLAAWNRQEKLRMKVTTRRDEIILGQAQKSAINGLGCLGNTLDWIRMLRRYCSADFTRKEKSVWQPGIDRHFL